MKKLTAKLSPPLEDQALRSGDFFLMPEFPVPPAIVSDLDKNIRQKTWIGEYVEGEPRYLEIEPIFGRFTVLAGTAIEMFVIAEDPSLVDPSLRGDDSRLQYVWKRNGASIVEVNALNNGKGISGLALFPNEVDENVSGIYTCEVSNVYGTKVSTEIELVIVDPKNHPMLFKNLLKNGSSTTNWSTTQDVITRDFIEGTPTTNHYGSLPYFCYYGKNNKGIRPEPPQDFRFSQGGHSSLLYNILKTWESKDPNLYNLSVPTTHNQVLPDWMAWMSRSIPPQIVPNEDVETGKFAAFFPGLRWMDSYNKNLNSNLIGLSNEVESQILTYITRNKLKFKKDGGSETAVASQTVDLSDIDAVIDGKVLGLKKLQAQFFAYVGAGITGYQIKATTIDGDKVFNWYVKSTQDLGERLRTSKDIRVELVKDSVIEIIPLMQDTTTISLVMRDTNGNEIRQYDIQGPDAADVFAIKEKSYLPMTWYPIFDLFIANNNTIKIFGQKYSSTTALLSLMSPNPEIPANLLIGYEYSLKLTSFDGNATKRRSFKNIFNEYGYSDDFAEQILGAKGSWDIEVWFNRLTQAQRASSIPVTARELRVTSLDAVSLDDLKQYQRKKAYMLMKNRLQAVDSSIRVDLLTTPIYRASGTNNETTRIDAVNVAGMDRNAAFFIKKIPFKEGGRYIPKPTEPNWVVNWSLPQGTGGSDPELTNDTPVREDRTYKALEDFGAAAMFGVGATVEIPKNTRSIDVVITFTHTSDAIEDGQPESRGWTKSEIYRNDYTTDVIDSTNKPVLEYGYPRCGVTLAKLQLLPAGIGASSNYTSYFIPPAEYTVLGLRKRRLYEDVNDTSTPGRFVYDFQMPKAIPQLPGIDFFNLNKVANDYARGIRKDAVIANLRPTDEEIDKFEKGVGDVEDASKDRIENIEGVFRVEDTLNNVQVPEDSQSQQQEETQP